LLLRSTEIPPHRPKDFPTTPTPEFLCPQNKVLWPRENILPRKKFLPCGRQRARGSRVRVEGGEREGKHLGKHLGPKNPSSRKSFPPLNGCKLGPGAQPPGPRRAFYRNFRRGIFPFPQSEPP